jgi:hypothetical protein
MYDGDMALLLRAQFGRLGLGHRSPARHDMPPWRRYYSARNLVAITRRYGTTSATLRVALEAGAGGSVKDLRRTRSMRASCYPLRGAIDGLCGRSGMIVPPGRK